MTDKKLIDETQLLAIGNLKWAVEQSLPLLKQQGLFITYERLKETLEQCDISNETLLYELWQSRTTPKSKPICTCGKSDSGMWHDQGCPLRE